MSGQGRHARTIAGAACAALLLGFAAPSDASRMIQNNSTGVVTSGTRVPCNDPGGFTHWNTPNINWFHNPANQGAGKGGALASALNSWTAVANADYALALQGTTGAGFNGNDGINGISW